MREGVSTRQDLGTDQRFFLLFFHMVRKIIPHILKSVLGGRDREKVELPPKRSYDRYML